MKYRNWKRYDYFWDTVHLEEYKTKIGKWKITKNVYKIYADREVA